MTTHLFPVASTLEEAREIAKQRLAKSSLKIPAWDIRKDYDGYYVCPCKEGKPDLGYDSVGAFVERVSL